MGLKSGRSPLRRIAARKIAQHEEDMEWRRLRALDHPDCVFPGCSRLMNDLHEPLLRSRGGSISDEDGTVSLCRTHHRYTHEHPVVAECLGLMVPSWVEPKMAARHAEIREWLLKHPHTPPWRQSDPVWCRDAEKQLEHAQHRGAIP